MSSILIYNYNNYYNRKVKKEDNLTDYGTPVYIETGTNINFNPSDGVMTQYVAGKLNNKYEDNGNYLIYSTDNTNITSRWFILEADRLRGGQYQLTLRRDTVVDYLEDILDAPSYIERAIVDNENVLIFNPENVTLNQIKKEEKLLKDDTKCAWLVGFINRTYAGGSLEVTANIISDFTYNALNDWALYEYYDKFIFKETAREYRLYFDTTNVFGTWHYYIVINGANKNNWKLVNTSNAEWSYSPVILNATSGIEKTFFQYIKDNVSYTELVNGSAPYIDNITSYNTEVYYSISSAIGKVVEISGGIFYAVKKKDGYKNGYGEYNISQGALGETLTTIVKNFSAYKSGNAIFIIRIKSDSIKYTLQRLEQGTYKTTIAGPDRLHLKDAPYDMFCIPYSDQTIKNSKVTDWQDISNTRSLALSIAQGIAVSLGSNLYDIQLLPFCPMTGIRGSETELDINSSEGTRYVTISDSNNKKVGVLLWSAASSNNVIIPYNLEQTEDIKLSENTTKYRLAASDYSSYFDFSPWKNGGISGINVDFTYIPFGSYIHINPNWGGLYGSDFGDYRGLIIQGSFSIANLSDKWIEYQIQNSTFQKIFDRETQTLNTNRGYQRADEIVGAIAGSFQTSAQGFMVGGPIGAIAGGVLGLGAGLTDYGISEAKYQESLASRKDIFELRLDAIQALPRTLSKVSSYVANNKIFPMIEIYECTDTEKQAFIAKIENESMTVGIYDTIRPYTYNSYHNDRGFIRAKPIKIEAIGDTHLINAISEELQKGVYFK